MLTSRKHHTTQSAVLTVQDVRHLLSQDRICGCKSNERTDLTAKYFVQCTAAVWWVCETNKLSKKVFLSSNSVDQHVSDKAEVKSTLL